MNRIFAGNLNAYGISFVCLVFAGMSAIQILMVKRWKVKERKLAENRRTVLELSRAAMDILLKPFYGQERDEETDMCQAELIRYVKDDLLECLASGDVPVSGLIRAHPYIVLKYPEIFERIEGFAGDSVKEIWRQRKESVERLRRK